LRLRVADELECNGFSGERFWKRILFSGKYVLKFGKESANAGLHFFGQLWIDRNFGHVERYLRDLLRTIGFKPSS
jgi:hypothetical protein